jgi:hypothetical protein
VYYARLPIASPANLMLVMVLRMALLEMVFGRKRIFLYRLASRASISFLFHNPATYMGVPM